MQVTDVFPKDVHVILELSAIEITDITKALDHAKVDFDGEKEPGIAKTAKTLERFYKMLREVEDGLPKRPAA